MLRYAMAYLDFELKTAALRTGRMSAVRTGRLCAYCPCQSNALQTIDDVQRAPLQTVLCKKLYTTAPLASLNTVVVSGSSPVL